MWVQGARIGLKINVKKSKPQRPGIGEDEKVTLGNKKIIRWTASPTLVVLLVKIMGAVKMLKVE